MKIGVMLFDFWQKHDVKIIATNNTFYMRKMECYFFTVCVMAKTTSIGRGRGYRYGLPNQEYYFKSGDEMKQLLPIY
jgi:DNA polymerase-3 subunit alpha